MAKDCGVNLAVLKVDGGMTVNNLFLQMQSDLLTTKVCKLSILAVIISASCCISLCCAAVFKLLHWHHWALPIRLKLPLQELHKPLYHNGLHNLRFGADR